LPVGVVVAAPDGRIVFRNAAAVAMAGTHVGVLLDDAIERHLRRARRGRQTEELLEFHGPPRMVMTVRAAMMPDGGAFVFVEDVSERRRIDAVRTDFVANISHELKTPVGALAVLAEALGDETDPDVIRRLVDRMLEESHRAVSTIDDLLELSQIELAGDIDHEEVHLGDVVRAGVSRVASLAEQADVTVSVIDDGRGQYVLGDRRQLVSALGNLVENAVKYSEPGQLIEIEIRCSDGFVDLVVSDHGVGIPARDLDRVFERFYRVDKARSRGTGGSGLGLSIVRHVATNHHGTVTVTSREGEGSTFVLRLPGPVTPTPTDDSGDIDRPYVESTTIHRGAS
jgi:two-component system sensor histidine kinase SenX3